MGNDYLLTLHDHTSSLEDHVKLVIKRANTLGQLEKSYNNHNMSLQSKYKFDNEFSKDKTSKKIVNKSVDEDRRAKTKVLIDQIEIDLKSVALDWKSCSKFDECTCSIMFDAFNKKVNNFLIKEN